MSIDYAGIFTGLVDTVFSAINQTLPIIIPILGVLAAISVGVKLFRKFTGR